MDGYTLIVFRDMSSRRTHSKNQSDDFFSCQGLVTKRFETRLASCSLSFVASRDKGYAVTLRRNSVAAGSYMH